MAGLLGGVCPFNLEIRDFAGKGRGVVVLDSVPKGAYVLEYEYSAVYGQRERARHEEEYEKNGEGCYILDVLTKDGWVCLDATRSFLSFGRLLNHASKSLATLSPHTPLLVEGKWRVGFTATGDLLPGDELTWDYSCPPEGIMWLERHCKDNYPFNTQQCSLVLRPVGCNELCCLFL